MAWWLFKTEPDVYGIDDLAREGECGWEGIRNYQARNRLRDEVRPGDQVFIYHSSCSEPAVVGIGEITQGAHPDPCQFDDQSPYFDPKSEPASPRWLQVRVRYTKHLPHPVTLKTIKSLPGLEGMELVHRSRLSIQKVTDAEADRLLALGRTGA